MGRNPYFTFLLHIEKEDLFSIYNTKLTLQAISSTGSQTSTLSYIHYTIFIHKIHDESLDAPVTKKKRYTNQPIEMKDNVNTACLLV